VCAIRGDVIVEIHPASYTPLDLLALARRLAEAETSGRMRLRRYDLTPTGLRLELEHPDLAPVETSPLLDRGAQRADLWRLGAIVVNQGDGAHAVSVVPALLRDWGGLALPVVPRADHARKRRHASRSADELVGMLIGDIAETRTAPYADAAERLRQLHTRFLPAGSLEAYVDGLGLPLPSQRVREAACKYAQQGAGPATAYRVLMALLRAGREIDGLHRRLRLDLGVGRLVWARTSKKSTDARDPRSSGKSPTKPSPA
jgi:hypothetical protein